MAVLDLRPFIQNTRLYILKNSQHCAIMFVLRFKMTIVDITIKTLFVLFNEKFKLNISAIHIEVLCRIRNSIKYAVCNMHIYSSFCEIDVYWIIFIGWNNHIHFLILVDATVATAAAA